MNVLAVAVSILFFALAASYADEPNKQTNIPYRLEEPTMTTVDGVTYKNVLFTEVTENTVSFSHSKGSAIIVLQYLPPATLGRLGIDPHRFAEFQAQQKTYTEQKLQTLKEQKEQEAKRFKEQEIQAEYDASQTAKGLVKFNGQWLIPAEAEKARVESEKAFETMEKSRKESKMIVEHLLGDVQIIQWSFTKEAFGTVMIADFTIKNATAHDIKDITITCRHYAASGTKIDSNTRTIYQIIPAGKAVRFRNINMGIIDTQVSTSQAGIDDYKDIE